MTTGFAFSHDCIILDACCVINLYASRCMPGILESISRTVAVAAYVRDEEALWIFGGPEDNVIETKEAIDLQPLIDQGLLIVVSPDSEAEESAFVSFAGRLGDDGEAVTGAIAVHRNWAIGTDDRKAGSFFAGEAPRLQLISTLELVKYWVDFTNQPNETVRVVLQNIRTRAIYEPGRAHPLYDWWKNFRV